jgi:hypothetical protein
MWLWLVVALEIIVAVRLARELQIGSKGRAEPAELEPLIWLTRWVIPQLRARRPVPVIEAQLTWRRAAEAHRRRREVF